MTVLGFGTRSRYPTALFPLPPLKVARSLRQTKEWLVGLLMTGSGWALLLTVMGLNFAAFSIGLALAGAFPRIFRIPNSRIASLQRRPAFTGR